MGACHNTPAYNTVMVDCRRPSFVHFWLHAEDGVLVAHAQYRSFSRKSARHAVPNEPLGSRYTDRVHALVLYDVPLRR